jgi:hypothetical protein
MLWILSEPARIQEGLIAKIEVISNGLWIQIFEHYFRFLERASKHSLLLKSLQLIVLSHFHRTHESFLDGGEEMRPLKASWLALSTVTMTKTLYKRCRYIGRNGHARCTKPTVLFQDRPRSTIVTHKFNSSVFWDCSSHYRKQQWWIIINKRKHQYLLLY